MEIPRGAVPLLRPPRLQDGEQVYQLVRASPPLDVNSAYNYFLLCLHFAETCVVAEVDDEIVGFLSAYRPPMSSDSLFVWQIAVAPLFRGQRLAGRMLEQVMLRPSCKSVRYLEATVGPLNVTSRRVFERFAAERGAGWSEELFLEKNRFCSEQHDDEVLIRVGPFNARSWRIEDAHI